MKFSTIIAAALTTTTVFAAPDLKEDRTIADNNIKTLSQRLRIGQGGGLPARCIASLICASLTACLVPNNGLDGVCYQPLAKDCGPLVAGGETGKALAVAILEEKWKIDGLKI